MNRLKGDTVPGLILFLIGLAFFVPSVNFGILPTTKDGVLGAGFFPAVLSVGIMIAGLIFFIQGLKENGNVEYFSMDEEQKANLKPFFITIAAVFAFMLIWLFVDFFVAMAAFCIFMNWVYKRTWKFNLVFTAGFVISVYVAFTFFLKIQFDL